MRDDMTDEKNGKWLPPVGWVDVEIVKMVSETSSTNNPMFIVDFVSANNPGDGLQQRLTNISGKRWLLRQLLEACGIEPETVTEEFTDKPRKIYDWEISDIEGKTVSAEVTHEPNDWEDKQGKMHHDTQAKFIKFKKLSV